MKSGAAEKIEEEMKKVQKLKGEAWTETNKQDEIELNDFYTQNTAWKAFPILFISFSSSLPSISVP